MLKILHYFCWGTTIWLFTITLKTGSCGVMLKPIKDLSESSLSPKGFWDGMAQFMVRQMVSELRSWVWVTGVSLWGRDCWEDRNLTPYNYSKNRPVWCDVETHKRFECVFLITNWFCGGMAQLTVWKFWIKSLLNEN